MPASYINEHGECVIENKKRIMIESPYFDKDGKWIGPEPPAKNKILSAKEALVKTKETHLKAIESYILAAIEKGQTYCEIMPSQQFVSQENQQILKDAGYTVTEKETMLGKEIKISWE